MSIQDVDIRLVLYRLRPTSEYHWKGTQDFGNTLEVIGEWRDPNTTKPTQTEILIEWEVYQREQSAQTIQMQELQQRLTELRLKAGANWLAEADFNDALPLIRQLAQKVAWLELELFALKHGALFSDLET